MSTSRAARWLPARFVVLALAALSARAQDARAAAVAPAEAPAPSPPRERLVSSRVAALLSAALPALPPLAPSAPPATNAHPILARVSPSDEPAGSGILRMPIFSVTESKPPPFAEVEHHEIARRAMEKYLGPEDGFDRGFLNLITAKQFPLLALIGSVSNEARAMGRYREDERLRLKADLLELSALAKLGGDAAGGKKLQHETQQAFRRD
jgi:hypothetical protein